MNVHLFTDIAWVLINFLWQGCVIALGTFIALRLIGRRNSHGRYLVALTSLFLMISAPVVTIVLIFSAHPQIIANNLLMAGKLHSPEFGVVSVLQLFSERDYDSYLPIVTLVWMSGVAWLGFKHLVSTYHVYKIRTYGLQEVSKEISEMVYSVSTALGVYFPVQVFRTKLVSVPCVMGVWKPIILLPFSGLTGLSSTQLELILAHEIAHIRRFDYLINIFQCLIEVLLFFHPAVHWVSRLVREERENCCDEIALAYRDRPMEYAQALLSLADTESQQAELSVAATDGDFASRIKRLLAAKHRYTFTGNVAALFILMLPAVSVFAYSLNQLTAPVSEPELPTELSEQTNYVAVNQPILPVDAEDWWLIEQPVDDGLMLGLGATELIQTEPEDELEQVAPERPTVLEKKVLSTIKIPKEKPSDSPSQRMKVDKTSSMQAAITDADKLAPASKREKLLDIESDAGNDANVGLPEESQPGLEPESEPEILNYAGLGSNAQKQAPVQPSRIPSLVLKSSQQIPYPHKARVDRINGYVVVNYNVLPNGKVKDVVVLKSEPIGVFEKLVRRKVRRWRYEPYETDDNAVLSVTQRIEFNTYDLDTEKKSKYAQNCVTGSRICRAPGSTPTRNVITLVNGNTSLSSSN